MNNRQPTQEDLNKIIGFRQAIYAKGFRRQRDALLETWDALCVTGGVSSFPLLSQSSVFRRQWHSLYKGLERGRLDESYLAGYLAQQVPASGIQFLSLDSTLWARPSARTMEDRQYVHQPSQAANGGDIGIGYPYSLLDWVPEAHRSWSLPVSVKRIPGTMTASEMGVEQIKAFNRSRADLTEVLDIVAGDAFYGNAKFLRALQGERNGTVVRLRRDRVLYRAPEQPAGKRPRGRPPVHGERFAFKEPDTWGEPDEVLTLEHPRFGQVRLERWNNLHGKKDPEVPFDVVRASVHLEREKPPRPFWLAWQAPPHIPAGITVTAETIWLAYTHRWPVEPGIRFRKQRLGWTRPCFHRKETGDRWSWLVALSVWLLFLARPLVQDNPLPWQKPQQELTPQRVQQGLPLIFGQFDTLARPPKRRGKSPGWPKGRRRTPKPRHKVLKKQPDAA
jgi:hypothetical protein